MRILGLGLGLGWVKAHAPHHIHYGRRDYLSTPLGLTTPSPPNAPPLAPPTTVQLVLCITTDVYPATSQLTRRHHLDLPPHTRTLNDPTPRVHQHVYCKLSNRKVVYSRTVISKVYSTRHKSVHMPASTLPRLALVMPAEQYGSSSSSDSDVSSASSTTSFQKMHARPVAEVQILRCMRCARAAETTTTDDASTAGMVRVSHNLYYCDRCAKMVGYKV